MSKSTKKARKNKAMNEVMNELPSKTANELAIAYETASAPTEPTILFATSEDAPVEVAVREDAPVEVAASEDAPVEVAASEDAPVEVATSEPTIAAAEEPSAPPIRAVASNGLRLRMKVWTDRPTGKSYLMPSAFMRDVVRGQPVTDVMYAYAMRDDDTKIVTLTAAEWNALPFYYFKEDGPAPRATSRPADVVDTQGRPT
jgi:hypothetical protein